MHASKTSPVILTQQCNCCDHAEFFLAPRTPCSLTNSRDALAATHDTINKRKYNCKNVYGVRVKAYHKTREFS